MGLPVISPDISVLDFSILYDISGAAPTITLTNTSTVTNPTALIWWYTINTPSGTPIHTGSVGTPDVNHVAWTTLTPSEAWPLIFGTPPCSQIEFSSGIPYTTTLFVKDSAGNTFSLTKNTTICRPNGNVQDSCGSFGQGIIDVQVQCQNIKIYTTDKTNYAYQNQLTPILLTNNWTLTYPPDEGGNVPSPKTATNTPYVNFPFGYGGDGYNIFMNAFATYDMGNGCSIKVQYKSVQNNRKATFGVWCGIDLCKLSCGIRKLYETTKNNCGELDSPSLDQKLSRATTLFSILISAIIQPLCDIDVTKMRKELESLLGLGDCCCAIGINPSNPNTGSTGACCPTSANVQDKNTGTLPAACPGSYFPANVYDPTGTIVIGTATNINDLIALLNGNPAWQAYGVAFAEGNCKVGWFPSTGGVIPVVIVDPGGGVILPTTIVMGTIVIVGTTNPPPGCPSGNPYPLRVYDPTGTIIIGIANSINDVVSLLNGYPAWQVYGTASVQDNCHVQWALADPMVIPPVIPTDTNTGSGGSGCVNGSTIYTLYLNDVCNPTLPISSGDFPMNGWVDFGLGAGPVYLGVINNITDFINALNAEPTKPASITFSTAGTPDISQIKVTNTNCVAYSGVPVLSGDKGSAEFLIYGASHTNMNLLPPSTGRQEAMWLRNSSILGRIPPGIANDEIPWHTITIGNTLITAEGNTGKVYFWDITNPLNPVFIRFIQLSTVVGTNFSGTPLMTGIGNVANTPSFYSLYFPTDYQNMTLNKIYVCEAISGTIWEIDMTDLGSGVTAAFQDNKLIGKCPRIITRTISNGKLYLFFTQDGSLETDTSQTSGVAIGNITILDLSVFNAGGLDISTTIFLNQVEYVYAATFDGIDSIWFVSDLGGVAQYSITSGGVTNRYLNALGYRVLYRGWAKYFNGNLYVCSLMGFNLPLNTGVLFLPVASLASSIPLVTLFQTVPLAYASAASLHAYSIIPLGNCLMLVAGNGGMNPGGAILIYKTDGTFLGIIQQAVNVNIFNVAVIPNVNVDTPNSFVP